MDVHTSLTYNIYHAIKSCSMRSTASSTSIHSCSIGVLYHLLTHSLHVSMPSHDWLIHISFNLCLQTAFCCAAIIYNIFLSRAVLPFIVLRWPIVRTFTFFFIHLPCLSTSHTPLPYTTLVTTIPLYIPNFASVVTFLFPAFFEAPATFLPLHRPCFHSALLFYPIKIPP